MRTLKSTKTSSYLGTFLANNLTVYLELKEYVEKVTFDFSKHWSSGRYYLTLKVNFHIKDEAIPKGDTFIAINSNHYDKLEVYVGKIDEMGYVEAHNKIENSTVCFYNILTFFKEIMTDVDFEIINNEALQEGSVYEMKKIIS